MSNFAVELGPICPVTSVALSVWSAISSANENVDMVVTNNTNSTWSTVQTTA
jgi:hypothetical protein